MMKKIFDKVTQTLVKGQEQKIRITLIKQGKKLTVEAQEGQNLMDLTNSFANEGMDIFGLCDKQLACTTCSVHILSKYTLIPLPTEEEKDILFSLKEYYPRQTRMSCQIKITKELDGMEVKIPTEQNKTSDIDFKK